MTNDQSALGRPCDIFIVDDPYDGFDEANSIDKRDHIDMVVSQYTSRLNKGGSVVVLMSRLHPDDVIGRRIERRAKNWTYIHKVALIDEGLETERALAPHIMSVQHLKDARAELFEADPAEIQWHSQFQNDPREGNRGLFRGTAEFTGEVPEGGRTIIGVDAAFSVEKSRDFFAAVVLKEIGNDLVVVDVIRDQKGTLSMLQSLKDLKDKYKGARMFSYVSGPEIGVYHHMAVEGIFVHQMRARWHKEFRARPCAAAWERGMIKILPHQKWTGAFLREVHSFTGEKDGQDDQVDAMVSAFDALKRGKSGGSPSTFGGPFTH
jgi:predicted phage terminase large subunit-like protein